MLARPETVVTSAIARLKYSDKLVTVSLREYNDTFRDTVKGLRFKWDGFNKEWYRPMTEYSGNAIDRAAEVGCHLLAAGFIVEFPDEAIFTLATTGTYAREHKRWISVSKGGRFRISCGDENAALVRQALKISGAHGYYDSASIYVGSTHYEEVLDFAETHGFRLTNAALKVAEKARAELESALLVNVTIPEPEAQPETPALVVPDNVDIDDELLDEAV